MSTKRRRRFTREYKLWVVGRMEAGEGATALSDELKIKRELLCDWRRAFRLGGAQALRPVGRPTEREVLAAASERGPPTTLADAHRQIAELERKVGQQQVDLDFFTGALRRVEELRRLNPQPGATASSLKSRR